VALLSALKKKQMPKALLFVGKIEIWDVETRKPLAVDTKALDNPMSWFPDGKRLAYVKLVPRNQLAETSPGLDAFGTYGGERWDEVPAVYTLDTESGISTFLHVGWTPIVSSNGKTILVGGWNEKMDFTWRSFRPSNHQSVTVRWPGDHGGAIAMPTENMVLYWGSPTTGLRTKHKPLDNIGHGGPKPVVTLKVADVGSGEFQTVVPDIDPRILVSFGQIEENAKPPVNSRP
jgi:hypothetical protein